jgi:alpha-L-fucosidase 2
MSNTLWYTQPASAWQEALPLGNGRLGSMIFGGVRRDRIQLNEDTLWGGSPYTPANPTSHPHLKAIRKHIQDGQFDKAELLGDETFLGIPPRQPAYQTVGDLFIEMHNVPEVISSNYRRELCLDNAQAKVDFTYKETDYSRRYLVSPSHQVLAVSISASRPNALNLNIFASSPHASTSIAFDGDNTFILSGRASPENGMNSGITFQVRCSIISNGGTTKASAGQLQVRDATEITLYLAIATSYVRYDNISGDPGSTTSATLSSCAHLPFDTVASVTALDHKRLFDRVSLVLPSTPQDVKPTDVRLAEFSAGVDDPGLISLYFQFGRYLLISSSRPGSQPANLQGIWNDSLDPGWGCGYTININTEMNYWLAEPAGVSEMVEPLIELVQDLAETGRETARTMYGADGWVCHQSTDLWRATAPCVGARWSLWPTGGAWLCRHLWDHYDYGRDLEYLRAIYPVLREACRFFLSSMITDPITGHMVTSPSCSPENVHGANGSSTTLCAGPTMDTQIIRDLLNHTRKASELLDEDPVFRIQLAALESKLVATQVGTDGRIMEWPSNLNTREPEPHHRHTSHLYGVYPSSQISLEAAPELAEAAKVTLIARGEPGTGWAAAWRLNLWARLQDTAKTGDLLQTLLGDLTYPNLFDVHPPQSKGYTLGTFQIDGNLGGAAGILEMLVQSPEGTDDIWVLPALPRQLPSGSLSGVRVRGRWTVDIDWKDNVLSHVVLTADIGGARRVHYQEISKDVSLEAGQSVKLFGARLSIS